MGGGVEKLEDYIMCPPRKVKDTHMIELEKCECVLSVLTISPIINIDRGEMVTTRIIMVIDDGVYVFICKVYSYVLKEYTQH